MKNTQRKPKSRRGPTVKQVGAAIAKDHPTVAELASPCAQGLVSSAMRLGAHNARAQLLAPILESMATTEKSLASAEIRLSPSACRIVLACLAEAGYAPKPVNGESDGMLMVAMPPARKPASEEATAVAKAA